MATSLKAIVSAIDTAAPTTPKPAATDAAPAMALMPDESVAVISTLVALIPRGPSPSTNACTCVEMRFMAAAPAPLRLAPTTPAEMRRGGGDDDGVDRRLLVAVIDRAPAASMLEFDTYARTWAGYEHEVDALPQRRVAVVLLQRGDLAPQVECRCSPARRGRRW